MPINHKLLLDENLSWRVARDLTKAGYDVLSTTQSNTAGLGDHLVFQRAQQLQRILVTRDSDFLARFAPPHHGIIVLNCDGGINNGQIVQKLLVILPDLLAQDLSNTVSTVEIP
jgi:predicted nuclease of predicted toxin-antitoxin system